MCIRDRYGTTLVVDFNNLSLSVDATVPSLQLITSGITLVKNTSYAANTTSSSYTVNLPANRQTGDFVELHDTESNWDINNLMVATPNNEQFKNYEGVIDSPLACDVAGAAVKLVWTDTYWRVFA